MYRFLLSVRWVGFAIFVIALATICTRLGLWQFHKLDLRLEQNKVVTRHFAAEPVDIAEVVRPGDEVSRSEEFTRVTATGTYDVEHQVTVKFTTRDGAPGVDVVVPLVLPSGDAVLVDRGWQQTRNTMETPDVPPPPPGEVTIEGWLRPDNRAEGDAVRPIEGQVRAISSTGMADHVPHRLMSGYVNLRSEDPPPAESLEAEPEPELGQGPHFFYALQWWFFALLAVVGYFWFARAEAKERLNPNRVDHFAKPERAQITPG